MSQGSYKEAFDLLSESQKFTEQLDARLGHITPILKVVRGITSFGRFLPVPFLQQVSFVIHSVATAADSLITLTRDSQYLIGQLSATFSQKALENTINTTQEEQKAANRAGDRPREARAWIAVGKLQRSFANYQESKESFDKALKLAKQLEDPELEAEAHLGLANSLQSLGKPEEAKSSAETAKQVFQDLGNSSSQASALLVLGSIALGTGDFEAAKQMASEAQALFEQDILAKQSFLSSAPSEDVAPNVFKSQDIREARLGIGEALLLLSSAELNLGNLESAQKAAMESLKQFRRLGDRKSQANAALALASAFQSLGQYQNAMRYSTEALFAFRNMGDRAGEAIALTNLGNILASQKRNEEAIRSFQLSQKIENNLAQERRQPGLLPGIIRFAQGALGFIFNLFPSSTSSFVWKATGVLETVRGAVDIAEGAGTPLRIGNVYLTMGNQEQAKKAFEEARKIANKQSNPSREAAAWLGLSETELNFLNNPQLALSNAQEAAKLFQKANDLARNAYALLAQATAYLALSKRELDSATQQEYTKQALILAQAALVTFQSINDKAGEARAFASLGNLQSPRTPPQENLAQTLTAIAFYKRSVELTEEIRQKGIRQRKYQVSYTSTVSETYRRLADLLLELGRVKAAQRVLELLKIQEIHEYVADTRADVTRDGKVVYTPLETDILTKYQDILDNKSFVALGQKFAECNNYEDGCSELKSLRESIAALNKEFNDQVQLSAAELIKRRGQDYAFQDPINLAESAQKLVDFCAWRQNLKPCSPTEEARLKKLRTMLIYPFLQDGKLWLLWAAPGNIAGKFRLLVEEKELRGKVIEFLNQLKDEKTSVQSIQSTANTLYKWLIAPLQDELNKNGINNLIFSLDRATRYIPMAALFDGEKYLVEKFKISTILTTEKTNPAFRPVNPTVLALGSSQAINGFSSLGSVRRELNAIVRAGDSANNSPASGIFPGLIRLDQDFNFDSLKSNLRKHNILHIATHGKFVPDAMDASFLLMGDGSKLTINMIRDQLQDLGRVHTVVLSACETGIGEQFERDGLEIAGLSYHFMNPSRAKTVIASLWAVKDDSTAKLMELFYKQLGDGKMTTAEALQQTQILMIKGKTQVSTTDRTRSSVNYKPGSNQAASLTHDLSHPYYWAPFILISNGL